MQGERLKAGFRDSHWAICFLMRPVLMMVSSATAKLVVTRSVD